MAEPPHNPPHSSKTEGAHRLMGRVKSRLSKLVPKTEEAHTPTGANVHYQLQHDGSVLSYSESEYGAASNVGSAVDRDMFLMEDDDDSMNHVPFRIKFVNSKQEATKIDVKPIEDFNDLVRKVIEKLKMDRHSHYILVYKDDEGDETGICSTYNLREMFRSLHPGTTFQLRIVPFNPDNLNALGYVPKLFGANYTPNKSLEDIEAEDSASSSVSSIDLHQLESETAGAHHHGSQSVESITDAAVAAGAAATAAAASESEVKIDEGKAEAGKNKAAEELRQAMKDLQEALTLALDSFGTNFSKNMDRLAEHQMKIYDAVSKYKKPSSSSSSSSSESSEHAQAETLDSHKADKDKHEQKKKKEEEISVDIVDETAEKSELVEVVEVSVADHKVHVKEEGVQATVEKKDECVEARPAEEEKKKSEGVEVAVSDGEKSERVEVTVSDSSEEKTEKVKVTVSDGEKTEKVKVTVSDENKEKVNATVSDGEKTEKVNATVSDGGKTAGADPVEVIDVNISDPHGSFFNRQQHFEYTFSSEPYSEAFFRHGFSEVGMPGGFTRPKLMTPFDAMDFEFRLNRDPATCHAHTKVCSHCLTQTIRDMGFEYSVAHIESLLCACDGDVRRVVELATR